MTTTKPDFVYVTYISTTPEKVYDALLDGEMTKLFWGRSRNVSDWKPGSRWSQQSYDDPSEVDVEGEVVEADRPRRLVLTWKSNHPAFKDAKPSRVTFDIEAAFGAVRLTVTHDEIEAGSPMLKVLSGGWSAILSSLKTLLETGQPLPMTTRRWKGQG
ncbi:MAG: SRPBCC family protein [Minicystis sp.]